MVVIAAAYVLIIMRTNGLGALDVYPPIYFITKQACENARTEVLKGKGKCLPLEVN